MSAVAARAGFSFDLAGPHDEARLRAFLRRSPMGRGIRVTFEREPDYFSAAAVQGDRVQVPVLRDPSGRAVGFGTRAVGRAYLNGEAAAVGYLGDLRLDHALRGGTFVARGYRYLRELHRDGLVRLYYTVIVSDNELALATIASGRGGVPRYRDLGLMLSPAVNLGRPLPPLGGDFEIVRGSRALLPEIVDCLNRSNARRQFAPVHAQADFLEGGRWRGMAAEDFYAAVRGKRVIGALGRWDQRAFKQTRVAGYAGALGWLRPLYNRAAPLLGRTPLPPPGGLVGHFYASFAAADGDDLRVFRPLLRRLYNDAVAQKRDSFFIIGLHEKDPLSTALREYPQTSFAGRLFGVCFEDGEQEWARLDGRVPHVEVAAL